MILLYDLAGGDGRRFSPNCWRVRMALAHKKLACRTVATRFTDIASIADGKQKTLPVIEDGGRLIGDSWRIVNYLEDTYPDSPSLFGDRAGHALTLFVQNWVFDTLHRGMIGLIVADIYDQLDEADKAYFRASRESRFGRRLEEIQADRDAHVPHFRKSLEPLRQIFTAGPWLGGETPLYCDYIVFGAFQWARMVSGFPVLAADDPVLSWFERCLDLFDGLGRGALKAGTG